MPEATTAAPATPAPAQAAPAVPAAPVAPAAAPASIASAQPAPAEPKPAEPKPGDTPPKDGDKPGEPKPGDKPAEQPKPDEQKRRASDKPVEYQEFKLPEGFQKDEKLMKEFTELAKAGNIPQEAAQKLVDMWARQLSDIYGAWPKQQEQWQKAWKEDAELGKDKFNDVTSVISQAIGSLKPEEAQAVRMALDTTGAGNNPAIGRLIYRLAVAAGVKPASLVPAGSPRNIEEKSAAQKIYPSHPAATT